MQICGYGSPGNWQFQPECVPYSLWYSGTAALIAHADLLHPLRDAIPSEVTVFSAPTPPEIIASYRVDPDHLAVPGFAIDLEAWLARQAPYDGPAVPQPRNRTYT